MCNQNKNSTGLIDGSWGFDRCTQSLLAAKIGGATAIQKLWVKWTVGSWSPVGTSIVLELLHFSFIHYHHVLRTDVITIYDIINFYIGVFIG